MKKNLTNTLLFFVLIGFVFLVDFQPALAHRPHDVVTEIELSPDFTDDKSLYIIVRNNLFKSIDKGDSWQRISYGIDTKYPLSSVAISPKNKNIIFLSSYGDGIYQSQDNGKTWQKKNQNLDNLNISDIKISPQNDSVLFAIGNEKDLYKSDNRGETWTKVISDKTKITSLNFAPENEQIMLAGDNKGNLLSSTDQGKTWSKSYQFNNQINSLVFSPNFNVDNTIFIATNKEGIFQGKLSDKFFQPLNQGLSELLIEDIAIPKTNSPENFTIFASTYNQGLFEFKNDTKTWQEISQGLTKDHQADQLKLPHFSKIALSNNISQEPIIFLAGFNGLFRSENAGEKWQELETLSTGSITSLAISPNYANDSTLAIVTYVGNPYISEDKGVTWKVGTKGLEIPRFGKDKEEGTQDPRRFFDVAFSPNYTSDNTIFASTLWTKIAKSTDQGKSWKIVALPKEVRGINFAISPNFASDKTIYVGNQKGFIFKSDNGGNKFYEVGKIEAIFGNDGPSMVISPDFSADKTLFAATKEGIYKTTDEGKNWQLTDNSLLKERNNLQLAISPNYAVEKIVFVGTDNGVFVTKNGGDSWSKLNDLADGNNLYIEGVAISPNYKNDQTILVSVMGKGLFKSINGGETFTNIGNNSLAFARMNNVPSSGIPIHFSPNYAEDKTIFGFGSAKTEVFKSTDGGDTWEVMTILYSLNEEYDWLTGVNIQLYLYRGKILRLLIAAFVGLSTYLLIGLLRLEKIIPLSKLQIKMLASVTLFLLASVVLYKL
jgi:photosystem II stability/assembly factor-like uncharacterized protein